MSTFYKLIEGPDAEALTASNKSLITSILSVGTLYVLLIPLKPSFQSPQQTDRQTKR